MYMEPNLSHVSRISDATEPSNYLERIKIIFLPCDPSETFVKKEKKYKDKFDVIFVSNALAHRVADAKKFLTDGGRVVVETASFMIDLKEDQKEMFRKKVQEMAANSGLSVAQTQCDKAEFLVYK